MKGKKVSEPVFYAVVGVGDRVLAVYGSARRHEADLRAAQFEQQTLFAARSERVSGRRPRVGEGFPWCNICRGEPTEREGNGCWGCGKPSQMGS